MSRAELENPVVVLGAGLAGLSAADLLSERGVEVVVLEKEPHPGGLASTVERDGFHFDYGPHRFHTTSDPVMNRVEALLPGNLLELERKSRIRLMNRYFHYPLSIGDVLANMPPWRGLAMVSSYIREKIRNLVLPRDDKDFESWVVSRFGRRLYDIYFGPYTAKLWGCRPSKLSADWASQRITVPSLSGLLKETVFPGDSRARSLVSKFRYPKGGIGRIADALAEKIIDRGGTIRYECPPRAIRRCESGGFLIGDGKAEIPASALVSTIPVDQYVALMGDLLPSSVHKAAEELVFRSIVFVALRVEAQKAVGDHWIYAPEEEYLFNRLSIPENFDPRLPGKGFQVVFEYSCQQGDGIWNGEAELVDSAVEGGAKLGLFRPQDVAAHTIARQSHAYPVYTMGYSRRLSAVLDGLDAVGGSVTCGRQGLFRYNNMDHSLEMGRYAALEILGEGSVREQFDWNPDTWADG